MAFPSFATLCERAVPTGSSEQYIATTAAFNPNEQSVPDVGCSASFARTQCFALCSDPFPGDVGFSVLISSGQGWLYDKATRLLVIRKNTDFSVTFSSKVPLPLVCVISAVVQYADPTNISCKGPVRLPPSLAYEDITSSRYFLRSKEKEAYYSSVLNHDAVCIPLAALDRTPMGPFGLYSFACQSSVLEEKPKVKAPDLELIFTLVLDGKEIARDVINIRVCSCIYRDFQKLTGNGKRKREPDNAPVPTSEPRSLEGVHPHLRFVSNVDPGDDGYYTFTWKGKDKFLFNLFTGLKMAYEFEQKKEEKK